MSFTRTVESRAYDHVYDPVYHTPYTGPVMRDGANSNTGALVGGTGRHKFFTRPVVPHLDAVAPEVLLAPTTETDPMQAPVEEVESRTKEASVQTKYRESEAQTNPYTPEFVIAPNQPEPEVLMLEGLTHERGLPVGRREIEMIAHAQQKRALEAALPPTTDESSLLLRKRLMEAQELREFAMRQKEMDAAHAARLDVLRAAVNERDEGNEFLAEQRIEALRQRRIEERDHAVARIQAQRIKVLRKLTKTRAKLVPPGGDGGGAATAEAGSKGKAKKSKTKKRDIIGDYSNFGSEVYAPIMRHGCHPDKHAAEFDVTMHVAPLGAPGAIESLESSMPLSLTRTAIAKPKEMLESGGARSSVDRHKAHLTADLEKMTSIIIRDHELKAEKRADSLEASATAAAATTDGAIAPAAKATGGGGELPSWRTRVSKAERPPTPSVDDEDENASAQQIAIVLLQRLLRGRAAQNSMFEGKERRKALIHELRAADELDDAEAAAPHLIAHERKEKVQSAALDTVAGETISNLFDLLSKELVRKEERERLQALAHHADEIRRQREAEESGRRQAEERVRSREDEVYKQVVRAHQGAAFSFVDALLDDSLETVASEQAMSELRLEPSLAAQIAPRATSAAGGTRAVTPGTAPAGTPEDELVRDLVASFLLPAVERVQVQHAVRMAERPYIDAAQRQTQQSVEDITQHSWG